MTVVSLLTTKAYSLDNIIEITKESLKNDVRIREYKVVKTIELNKRKYKEFTKDLKAKRKYIIENKDLCYENDEVLLITNKEDTTAEAIVVHPMAYDYAKFTGVVMHEIPIEELLKKETDVRYKEVIKYLKSQETKIKELGIKVEVTYDVNNPNNVIIIN